LTPRLALTNLRTTRISWLAHRAVRLLRRRQLRRINRFACALARLGAAIAEQRQVDLVDDLDDDAVRHGGDAAHDDLDLASFGVVTILEAGRGDTYPDMAWEPKAAFRTLAAFYGG
jgi:hypothetical protein